MGDFMKLYVLWVKVSDTLGAIVARYIDSQWATAEHAKNRTLELTDSLRACGFSTRVSIDTFYGYVADVSINETKPEQSE